MPPRRWTPPRAASADWGASRRPSVPRCCARPPRRLRERRLELAALQVRECAKPWAEADADVCEAIDFLEYYARAAIELERGRELLQVPGERNTMRYAPRGVVAVIAPWNFPLAIPTGMTAAGAGRRQRRGAEAGGAVAGLALSRSWRRCTAAGCRPTRSACCPATATRRGAGARPAGARDRLHRIERGGLEIVRAAAETPDGQGHVKRVVAEMGGKNCVIVDSDADLDEVVPAVVALGVRLRRPEVLGGRPGAGPRARCRELVERLAGAVAALSVGPGRGLRDRGPPVIERRRGTGWRATRAPAGAGADGARGEPVPGEGWFCPPTRGRRAAGGFAGAPRGDLRARCSPSSGWEHGGGVRRGRLAALRPHRRPVLAQPEDGRAGAAGALPWATCT